MNAICQTPKIRLDLWNSILLKTARSSLPKAIRNSARRKFSRRNLGKPISAPTLHGHELRLIAGDNVDNEILFTGRFEPHVSRIISSILTNADGYFLDVGCHLGYYSGMALTVSQNIRVLAVDANPVMTERCRNNLSDFPGRATIINKGVGAKRSRLTFNTSSKSPSLGTFGTPPPEVRDVTSIEIEVIPFSEIVDQTTGRIPLLKMDVEGFEYLALSALRQDQVNRIFNMIIEFSDERLAQCGQSRGSFAGLPWIDEFSIHLLHDNGSVENLPSLAEVPPGDQNIWLKCDHEPFR